MTEFVGRTGANRVYSYPETRRSGDPLNAFARNFASGPEDDLDISTPTQIPWQAIESGAPAGVNVPITPQATGLIRIDAVIGVENLSEGAVTIKVQVEINGSPLAVPFDETVTLAAGAFGAIPICAISNTLTVGVAVNVQILVTPSALIELTSDNSTLSLQEVSTATG